MIFKNTLFSIVLALVLQTTLTFARTMNKYQLVTCKSTSIEGSYLDTYWGPSCPNPNDICAGDPFTSGTLRIIKTTSPVTYSMKVSVKGVTAFNNYAVYFLPLGANPCNEKVLIGEFLTNAAGKGNGYIRDCRSAPKYTLNCIRNTGDKSNPNTMIPGPEAGTFFFYSRGTWRKDDGDIKSDDGTMTGLYNPQDLWGGQDYFDGIQFVTGIL